MLVKKKIMDNQPELHEPFPDCTFSAITFNLGSSVVTKDHRDSANYAAGQCAVHSLGDYDHEVSGHMCLWELGLLVEFPPGGTIFFPSAVVRHCNTIIPQGSIRRS
ncbi:hypothetical protein PUNSTDRAFT_66701 [Punctularia strigosozonata HHB-11173 SS5]|uniref:uncharacterized protein n=1 Tax=Punctularia strigosozonata (strain HHB-11173) TaxID=741275 RepID=UPI00044166E0|nr:uncharacterized protein PUNSTDRAFT_66701 [Punctularia strigosozonata HHB-11173 SS5]EIN10039.1 hypothetical protein PUNSTDRAFT_66701 [Punctularia strigosozonata HHB-11173 SS5]